MKILDFSKQEFDVLSQEVDWQKAIADFLKEWHSDSRSITACTSGSTGNPKEIKLPKEAMRLSAKLTANFFGLKTGDFALLCLPVNFIAGKMMLVRAIEVGLKLYICQPKSRIDIKGIETLDFVPMTPMQAENSFDSIHKIKTLLLGGAPLSDDLRKKLLTLKTDCFESYGMTETITHIGLKRISDEYFHTIEQVKVRKDENDCIVIQTPYFDKEIFTHDLVELKNGNEFKWLGRLDNVVNSGGIKLIPEQIETKLKSSIKREFIIGSRHDPVLGEKLILVVEGPFFFIKLPENLLSKFETPKEIYFLENFPRTDSGKIKRNEILKLI